MPLVIARGTVPDLLRVLGAVPACTIAMTCTMGFAWGFGAIMFGQGVSAVGIAMSNTLVLAIRASLGSFLPMGLLAPERLHQPQGHAVIAGTLVGITGIICCGDAGVQRERSQRDDATALRGTMVGKARRFSVGLLLCIGAGLLSAVLNIGYSEARPLMQSAMRFGASSFGGSNLIWLLMLTSGAVPNLAFCGWLMARNKSWAKYFFAPGRARFASAAASSCLYW